MLNGIIMAVINWAIGILPGYFRKLVSCDYFGRNTLHQQHRKRTNPQLTYSRAEKTCLFFGQLALLFFLPGATSKADRAIEGTYIVLITSG